MIRRWLRSRRVARHRTQIIARGAERVVFEESWRANLRFAALPEFRCWRR